MSDLPKVSNQTNPLAAYYRQPKIYIKLPSKGEFYPPGTLDVSESGEYPVYAMTAKDELMLKTPDALMNGQSTVEVLKSCVPALLDPWKMPSVDLDAILIAIRIATYGETMDVSANCPSCGHENDYTLNLVAYLERLNSFEYVPVIDIDPLTVYIKPYTYKEVTKTSIKALEQEKIFDIINSNDLTDEEKVERFGVSFLKLTELTIGLVSGSIEKIVTPEGEVTDKKHIEEFIANAPKEIFQKVQDHMTKMKEELEIKTHSVECSKCQTKFSTAVTLDQANFFAVRS